jgi:hypothetical protein
LQGPISRTLEPPEGAGTLLNTNAATSGRKVRPRVVILI